MLLVGRQGVRAVIAESFENLHKSQLVGMGIMPLQFLPGQTADSLELSGKERFTISMPDSLSPRQQLIVKVSNSQLPYVTHGLDLFKLAQTRLVVSLCGFNPEKPGKQF